jgi:hypothetical protein
MADKPLAEVLKSMVDKQTTNVGPVSNLLGTVAEVPVTGAIARVAEWRVYFVDSSSTKDLLSPNDIVSRSIATELRSESPIIRSVDGVLEFTPSKPGSYLFATVILAPQPFQFLLDVFAANSTIGIFLDETLLRRGSNKLSTLVGANDSLVPLNIIVEGKVAPIKIVLPPDVSAAVRPFVPDAPAWKDTFPIVTNYIDPKSGNTGNALFWENQEKVGGWGVYHIATTNLNVAKSVSVVNGRYQVQMDDPSGISIRIPSVIQIETLSGESELLGTVSSATTNADDSEIILTIDPALEFVDTDEVASGAVQLLTFEHLHDVVRFGSTEYVSFVDTNVQAGDDYAYTLDAFAPFDSSIRSSKAELKEVTAGDVTPPGSITIVSTTVLNNQLTLRYITPSDEDYLGTHAYFDNVLSGTQDSLILDYGQPGWEDALNLTLVNSGTYYFVTFDQVGNEQDVYSGETFVWDGTSSFTGGDQPPLLIVEHLTSSGIIAEGYDPLTTVMFRLDASDPDTDHDDLEINYLRIVDSGIWQTVPGPSLPTLVPIPRGNKETWIRVRAYDGALYSNELTFVSDFDTHPEISVVYDKFIVDSGVVFVEGSVDDDTKSLSWYIDDTFTGPQDSDPTSAAPLVISPLTTLKTFNFQYGIDDGQRKVAVINPYGDEGASGTAGLVWREDFVRPPRTLVFMKERTKGKAVSRTETLVTLSPIPSTARIFKKIDPADGANTFGTVTSAGASFLIDTSQAWTTDQWNDYYDVNIPAGTGEGQTRTITNTTSNTLSVSPDWTTTPDTTSTYHILEKFRLYSDNGTVTSATTTSLTDTTKSWTPDAFKNKTLSILTGTDAGATREIASGTTDTLYYAVALTGLAASDRYKVDGSITISKDPTIDKILSFYADVPGIATEEVQAITIDFDSIPELGALELSEPDSGKLKIELPNKDDDVKTWAAYVRKSDWPTKTLSVSGTLDFEYMRFQGAIENAPITFDVTSGEWFVMARPFDSFGTPGSVSADSITINNATPTEGAIIDQWVDVIDSTRHRIYYSHNSVVEKAADKADYKVVITAHRSDYPPGANDLVIILSDDRRTWQDSEDGDSVLNEDETTEAANSNTGQGSSVHLFASGPKWATWEYTIELYTDVDVLVNTYFASKSGYFTSSIPE